MPDHALRTLADEYWDVLLAANPTMATTLGDHRFDDRIEDMSTPAQTALRARWISIQDRLAAVDRGRLDQDDRVTYRQLGREIADGIATIDQRLVELQSDHMTGLPVGLLQAAVVMSAPDPGAAWMLIERCRQIPLALERAAGRFLEGATIGRTPARICISRSLNVIERYLSSPLDGDVFVTLAGPAGWQGEASWRSALRDVARDVIRPAYRQHATVLAERLLPAARPDDRCGLSWLADGSQTYATMVSHHTTTDLSPAEIHAFGIHEVTERLPQEYAEIGGRLFGTTDVAGVFDRLRHDKALRYESGEEIMADARRALAAATAAMGDWFGRLPKSRCAIEAVPDFLAADAPIAYYYPPPDDGSRPGTYYVNTLGPAERARYESASVGFHEAIPGHHLQLALATELTGLPTFRRFSLFNTAYIEGWGLYAERLADEMGLYPDDLARIGMLTADSLRACRLVVDTGLHHLGWSRQQAIDFMTANTPASLDEMTVEVDRYIGMPGQALAYKLGQREILRLRAAARSRLGASFDIKGFHDALLTSGAVTLPVLADLVEDWTGPSRGC